MRYIKKLSIIFVIAVFSLAVPVIASAATSGNCGANGDNVTWTLDDEGTLTISGEGDMEDYYNYGAPWYNSRSSITKVVIEQGVTSIGNNAFEDCSSLTSVIIPESVTSIGNRAFYGCSGLASVTIPNSVTSIGEHAFLSCSSLDSVYISDLEAYLNIDFGDEYANPMYYADKLYLNGKRVTGTVKIPAGVTKIPYCAFDGCDGIKSVEIPDNITSIGGYAFYNCAGLTNFIIPDSVTSIGESAFSGCSQCNVYYKDSYRKFITILNGTSDSSNSILHCSDLTAINWGKCGNSVAWFCDDEGAMTISGEGDMKDYSHDFSDLSDAPWYNSHSSIAKVVIEQGVTSIGSLAFFGCNGLTNITIPDSVIRIGMDAFSHCSSLTSVTIPDSVTSIGDYAFSDCSGLTSITIPDSITTIEYGAFEDCENLKNVYITDIAKWCEIDFGFINDKITSNPFYYAKNLYVNDVLTTELVIPNGVKSISQYAFLGCNGLTSITIPDSVESIGTFAFNSCKSLSIVNYNALKVLSNVFECDDSYYNYYNNIILIVLGDNVKSIDTNAFTDCANLKRIIIPKSVTEIEKAAFKDCTSLSTVEYGGSETDWNEIYIGTENENLKNANIVFNSSLSNTTLTDLDYLTYTVNEDNTVTITNCYENATKINIPKEIDGKPVTTINASAFANRAKLTSVTIPESVTSIGERAFYGCSSLTDIVIPDGVTAIESNTFYNCSKLKNVTIPKSVTAIKSYAFYGCGSLTDTYYSGSDADFGNIKIDYGNEQLTKSNIHYSGTTPTPTPTPAPTPIPVTTAEITKEETDIAYTFTVTPETAYENCFVYAAIYDANGALIALDRVPLEMTGSTSVSVDKQENGVTAKVFVWSDFMQSIIEHAEEFSLVE